MKDQNTPTNTLEEILRSEFYVNEHENCSKDCSRRFYADEAFSRAVAEIESLISQAVNKARLEEIQEIPDYGLEAPTDYACSDLSHQFNKCVKCYKEMRLYKLNRDETPKGDK